MSTGKRFRAKMPGRNRCEGVDTFASRYLCARMVSGSRGADGTTQTSTTATPLRHPLARDVAPEPVRHRRPRPAGARLDRDARGREAVVVAGAAAGTDGLRRFALPVLLRIRRQPEPDQPRATRRRPVDPGYRPRWHRLPGRPC